MSKQSIPGVTRANLLRIFVEGVLTSEEPLRTCGLKALNSHLQLFRGHKGKFTAQQITKLLEAAQSYMDDSANQIDLTRPILIPKSEGRTRKPPSRQARPLNVPRSKP